MRTATHDDVPRLVELGVAMHAESRYRDFKINTAKGADFFHRMIDHTDTIVLVEGSPIYAMFVGYVAPFWWGDDLESFDVLLYVLSEHRGKGYAAAKLVTAYTKWAVNRGVLDVKIAETTGMDSQRTGQFFERMGFERLGASFRYGNGDQTVH